jgi:hypothetical protein
MVLSVKRHQVENHSLQGASMKTVLLMCALSMVACSTRPVQPMTPVNHADYLPPTDEQEITLRDRQPVYRAPRISTPAERDAKLLQELQDEALDLELCFVVYGPKSATCILRRSDVCRVDVVILSNGDHVVKEYCRGR